MPPQTLDDNALLAYFAAHAPEEIPRWFIPSIDLPEAPNGPARPRCSKNSPEYKLWAYMSEFESDSPDNWNENNLLPGSEPETVAGARKLAEEMQTWRAAHAAWKADVAARDRLIEQVTFFQWRWYYARQMLAARPRG